MAAYATDFVEKVWPLNYRGSPLKKLDRYPSEGEYDPIGPSGGRLHLGPLQRGRRQLPQLRRVDRQRQETPDGTFEDSKAAVKALEGHFDPKFRGYDLDYPDLKRADRFIEELHRFEKEGECPG